MHLRYQEFKASRMRNAVSRRFTLCAVESCLVNATAKAPDCKRLCPGHHKDWTRTVAGYEYAHVVPVDELFALWCGQQR